MESIVVINRRNQSQGSSDVVKVSLRGLLLADPTQQFACWKTCLRSVYFLHPSELEFFQLTDRDQVYEAEKAFQFLLEVLCGLQSPMIGETEVLGQFKEFLQSHSQHNFVKREKTFFNQLLQSCKVVREKHLQQLGCHSYGSLARRLLKGHQSVQFIGAGQLVREILPWLKEVSEISIKSRDSARMQSLTEVRSNLTWQALEDESKSEALTEAVIICAPMTNQEVQKILAQSKPKMLLDLRGEYHFELSEIPQIQQYYSLNQFMDSIRVDRAHTELRVQEAKKHIFDLVEERRMKAVLRPLGWEDLWS